MAQLRGYEFTVKVRVLDDALTREDQEAACADNAALLKEAVEAGVEDAIIPNLKGNGWTEVDVVSTEQIFVPIAN